MLKTTIKRAAAAAIFAAFAVSATPVFSASQIAAAGETILVPAPAHAGCWTDEGYGRYSSCNAG